MKLYLSSYKLGERKDELLSLFGENKKIGYIPNACDYTKVDLEKKNTSNQSDMEKLKKIGLEVELLDLKDYFGKKDELKDKLFQLGGVFVRGGNTFVLRQAMHLSGFDLLFEELENRDDFVYSGYSAGICVLGPNLRALQIVDNPYDKQYNNSDVIWEGLGKLDYMILPHYKSNHPESEDIDKEVEYCKSNQIPFKTLKDGEVIIINN